MCLDSNPAAGWLLVGLGTSKLQYARSLIYYTYACVFRTLLFPHVANMRRAMHSFYIGLVDFVCPFSGAPMYLACTCASISGCVMRDDRTTVSSRINGVCGIPAEKKKRPAWCVERRRPPPTLVYPHESPGLSMPFQVSLFPCFPTESSLRLQPPGCMQHSLL